MAQIRLPDVQGQRSKNDRVLQLARRTNLCNVLGPGRRAVLWVQGCPFRCPGCVAPETLPFHGGRAEDIELLSAELGSLTSIEGVTFSGGEPMAQAAALVNLIDSIRLNRDLTFMSYTGYTLQFLTSHGTPAQKSLIERLDILIDGPYIADRHTDVRWRGSDNQKVHFLSPRYRHLVSQINDRGWQMEFEYTSRGKLHWMGIPPVDFRDTLERRMLQRGIHLSAKDNDHE